MSDLSSELRALMRNIGLPEGADEATVLKSFEGKKLPPEEIPDESEMRDEDEEDNSAKAKQAKKTEKGKVEKKDTTQTNGKLTATTKGAALSKTSATSTTATKSSTTITSLSRPKTKAADSTSTQAPQPPPTVDVPLNRPSLIKDAPAPSTIIAGGKSAAEMEGLKWHQHLQAKVVLTFEKKKEEKQLQQAKQPQGKKVTLDKNANAASSTASSSSSHFVLPSTLDDCYAVASERFTSIVEHFDALNAGRTSDGRWLSTVMDQGTLTDKIAGMTLMIQEAPIYRLSILDKMLAMAGKQNRRENTLAIDALKDLFINDLLPKRKLNSFAAQPYFKAVYGTTSTTATQANGKKKSAAPKVDLPPKPTETDLVYYYYEDCLKKRYLDFLGILETGTHDEMSYIKKGRITCLYELLVACPERERIILSLLVNKFGDSDRKISSKIVFYLTELITKHPGFKFSLITELEQLLYRENISKKAQYYAICFLNQFVFTQEDTQLANKLIHVYFLLFKQFLSTNTKEKQAEVEKEKKAAIRKKVRDAKKDGKMISFQEVKAKLARAGDVNEADDALRSKLLGGLLTGINRALPYASQGALEGDVEQEQKSATKAGVSADASKSSSSLVTSQIDMIFNLVHTTGFNTSIQALMLLYQALSRSIISGSKGVNVDRFYRALYEKLLAPELVVLGTSGSSGSTKHSLFLNLLFKSMKSDTNVERISSFTKRLLQIATQSQPNFICGILYLLSEVSKIHGCIRVMINEPQRGVKMVKDEKSGVVQMMEDDEEEHFTDAKEDGDEQEEKKMIETKKEPSSDNTFNPSTKLKDLYDPFKRDPQYSHASSTCLYELLFFTSHFHPSVVKFASDLAKGIPIAYEGDPLRDFTTANFLDRFVYKNPKKSNLVSSQESLVLKKLSNTFGRPSAVASLAASSAATTSSVTPQVNTPGFIKKPLGAVREELQFFHKYFQEKAVQDELKGKQLLKAKSANMTDMTEEEEDAYADDIIEKEMRKMDPDSWRDDDEDEIPEDEQGSGPDDDDEEEGEEGEEGEFDGMMDDDEDMPDIDADEDGEAAADEDDEDAEAAALAEMEGGGGDDEISGDDDDDEEEFNFDDSEDDDDDEDAAGPASRSKDRNASVFASAEEFAELLNSANDTGVSQKQSAWEKRMSVEEERDQPKGKGGKKFGGGGSGLYKAAPAPSRGKPKPARGGVPEKASFKQTKRKSMQSSSSKGKKGGGGNKQGGSGSKKGNKKQKR